MASHKPPLILHVVHSLEGGGTERTLVSLLRAFDRTRLRHALVTLRQAGSLSARLRDDVPCIPLNFVGRSRWSGLRLAGVCRRLRPAVIHARNVCTWSDALLARICTNVHAQLVLGFHGLQDGGTFSSRHRWIARTAHVLGAQFTSVSELGRRKMSQQLGIPSKVIAHLPNGIDLAKFTKAHQQQRSAMRGSLGLAPNDFVFGIVGSLTPVKGHTLLLDSFSQAVRVCKNIRLLVVGEGLMHAALESQARKSGIAENVVFAGEREDVLQLLQSMDAYVCASHSEGVSNALLEAMGCGLPVISTAVGDHPVILRHGTDGLLVPAGDASALAAAMLTLASSPDRTVELGRRARVRSEQFAFRTTLSAYENYYDSLINSQHTSAIARICRSVSKSVTHAFFPRVAAQPALE